MDRQARVEVVRAAKDVLRSPGPTASDLEISRSNQFNLGVVAVTTLATGYSTEAVEIMIGLVEL